MLRSGIEVLFNKTELDYLQPLLDALFDDTRVGTDYLREVLQVKVNWKRKLAALRARTGIRDAMTFHEFYAAMLLGQPRKGEPVAVRNCNLVRKLFNVYHQAIRAQCERLQLREARLTQLNHKLRSRDQKARGDHLRFLMAQRLHLALDERRKKEIRELFIRMRHAKVGTALFNLELRDESTIDVFLVEGDGSEALKYIEEVAAKKHVPVVEIKQ